MSQNYLHVKLKHHDGREAEERISYPPGVEMTQEAVLTRLSKKKYLPDGPLSETKDPDHPMTERFAVAGWELVSWEPVDEG